MKKAIKILAIILVLLVALGVVLTITYTHSRDYSDDTFPMGTRINGVNCSGLSYEEAADTLTDAWNSRTITVTGIMGEKLDSYRDFGCKYNIVDQISQIKSENRVSGMLNHYLHLPLNAHIAMLVESCGEDFENDVKSSEFISRDTVVECHDAYVDMDDPDFAIVPEVYGTKADPDLYFEDIVKCIETGSPVFRYDEQKYTELPKVRSDSEDLLNYQAFCRKHLKQKIEYRLGDETFTVPTETLKGFFVDSTDEIDKKAVRKYVENLADKYDNLGIEREFTSLTGKTFTVSGGTFGWLLDTDGEIKQLTSDLNNGKDVSREPVWSRSSDGEYVREPADTYVDADLSKQHVIYFRDGKKVFECDCVSGNKAGGHSTPTGVFYIINKLRNLVLRGNNDDGSKYESPVKYWCGFYSSTHGFHDADWRGAFGGSIYISNGSHGCINMPPRKMADFFSKIEVGTPVIVHY